MRPAMPTQGIVAGMQRGATVYPRDATEQRGVDNTSP